MTEFGDIFANALTTAVFVYGSVAILLGYALATLWASRRPRAVNPRWVVRRA